MTVAILTILGAVVPFLIWLYRRQAGKKDDPKVQTQKRVDAVSHEIATDNEEASRLRVAALLDRIRLRKAEGDKRGQGAPPS